MKKFKNGLEFFRAMFFVPVGTVPILFRRGLSRFMGMFFFPVRINYNTSDNQSTDQKQDHHCIVTKHEIYSSLSIIKAITKKISETPVARTIFGKSIILGTTNIPTTWIPIINFPISSKIRPTLCFCRFVSFIDNIMSQIKTFVKAVRKSFLNGVKINLEKNMKRLYFSVGVVSVFVLMMSDTILLSFAYIMDTIVEFVIANEVKQSLFFNRERLLRRPSKMDSSQ